jgi:23S rRNA (adenine2030-N6)-methyltransferase
VLSYRHCFHAGNFADVLKHLVVVEILQHLLAKDAAFHYVETHAGAGLFDLQSEQAHKLREHASGVGRLDAAQWPEIADYFAALNAHNQAGALRYYPGSPMLARHFMRRHDRAWLFELHSTDVELLRANMGRDRRIRIRHENGYTALHALLPPPSRRGLVLIDPSYELKSDFEEVVSTVVAAHKKFAGGIYAIWYPVVDRRRVEQLEHGIRSSGIRNVQRFELAVTADSSFRGMTASGMVVINPPWTLMAKMSQLLPRLVKALARGDGACFRSEILAGE